MNMDHLKLFTNLAETLNFSQTAKNLHLTQPAVTQAINSLEQEVGFKLFKRTKRQVSLTKGGHVLYTNVQPLLIKFTTAVETARVAQERDVATLSIGYTETYYELQQFPKLIKEFNKLHPASHVYLENFDHNLLRQHLLNQECDVTFPMQDSIQDDQNIAFIPLITGRFACIVPTSNPLANHTTIDITELADQTLIFLNANQCPPRQFAIQQLLQKACPNANYLYSDSIMLDHTLVKGGLGIAIMVTAASRTDAPDFRVIPLDYPGWRPYTYGMAVLKPIDDPVLKQFIACAQRIIH